MKCQFCKSELIITGETRVYVTGHEHVYDPNHIPPARLTNTCTCSNSNQYYWDDDGGIYIRKPADMDRYFRDKKEYGSLSALESVEREIEEEIEAKYNERVI